MASETALNEIEIDPTDEIMELQMGPSHPATHGTIKFNLKLHGEVVLACDVEVGYLHRGFEKMIEQGTWTQAIPYTDRLNYVSPLINNVGFILAVERLCGIEVPPRCQAIRVIMSEVSRICDHLTCLGMASQEIGAATAGFLMIEGREQLWDIIEAVTGARVTISYTRIGGVTNDFTRDTPERIKAAFTNVRALLADCDTLLTRNRIFYDRMANVGTIAREDAISYGLTGPLLRACGVRYDVRKAQPYSGYERYDFEVPIGSNGDNYDRYLVRFQEMEQSLRIVEGQGTGRPSCTLHTTLANAPGDDIDQVGSKAFDFSRNHGLGAAPDGEHGDHRRHPDHDPQNGQHRAQLVGIEVFEGFDE
jgi:NADH-quinone oxidoreductase subunit D